jgi:hypothetical protein
LTISPPDVMRESPPLLHLPPHVHSLAAVDEALDLLDAVGMTLDAAQEFTLRAALGVRSDNTWAAFEVADIQPRQNGKGETIQAREVAGLFHFGENLIIHTAHEFPTANEAFLRMVSLIESSPVLEAQVQRIRFANGEQGIELKSGARLKYRARTGGAGRGFAGASLVVYDEAYALKAEHVAASLPTLSTHPNPQVWYASSAGLSDSSALWTIRKRALSGDAGRLAYCEWTAENVSLDADGRVVSTPIDVRDRSLIAVANPAYPHRISADYIDAEHEAMGDEKFARERLGVWDPLLSDQGGAPAKLPAVEWADTICAPPHIEPGAVTISFGVDWDAGSASISVGAGTIAEPYVEVIEHRQGVGWLPGRLVELVGKWSPLAVGFFNAGPTASQLGPVMQAFRDAGIDSELLTPVGVSDYSAACGGFYADVIEGRLRRPDGQGPLDVAVADAAEHRAGEGWRWDTRNATVPLSPLEAVTVARALLPTEVPSVAPVFAY